MIRILLMIFLLLGTASSQALVVQSTLAGGEWSEPTTWIDEVVPGPADDVIIDGPVVIDGSASCKDLTVNADRVLDGWDVNTSSLIVNGNLYNDGAIHNGYYNLNIILFGDLSNDGIIDNRRITLEGISPQHLSMDGAATFFTEIVLDPGAIEIVYVDTDFTTSKYIDLNGGDMVLGGNASLNFTGGYFLDGNVQAVGRTISMTGGAYMGSLNVDSAVLGGEVKLQSNVAFTGGLIVDGQLSNRNTGNQTTSIDGDLIVNGSVVNDYYSLYVELTGGITNNGDISNASITVLADGDEHFIWDPAATFSASLIMDGASTGDIHGDTELRFASNIDLNGGKLRMMPGNDLHLTGGYFIDGTIEFNGNEVICSAGHYFGSAVLENARLNGTAIFTTNCSCTGGLVNLGTMQNRVTGNVTLDVQGGLTNEGIVTHDYYALHINLTGDLVNNGDWMNSTTTFLGAGPRNMSMDGDATFTSELYMHADATGDLIATTPLRLGDHIDLNGGNLVLNPGSDLDIDVGPILDGSIQANGNTLTFTGAAYISSMSVDTPILDGLAALSTGMTFTGGVIVQGAMENRNTGNVTVDISGGLANYGTIENNYYNLYINLSGDLVNKGVWNNAWVNLNGDTDQHLSQGEGSFLSCDLYLTLDAPGTVIVETPFSTDGLVDLNGGTMILEPGASFSQLDSYMNELDLVGNHNMLDFADGTWVSNATLSDVSIHGVMQASTGCVFAGAVALEDSLKNRNTGNVTLLVEGSLINRGLIHNNYYNLYLDVLGSILNEGVWTNSQVYLDGTEDQYVGATDLNPIDPNSFVLDSNITGPFQWYKDGLPIDGATGSTLNFDIIGDAEHGRYHCEGGAVPEVSRDIWIVEGGLSVDFIADTTSGGAPLTVNFTALGEGATSWEWDFDGDGTVDSYDANPSFEYASAGLYTVTLTVGDGMVSDSEVKTDYIEVTEPTDATPPALALGLEQNYPNPFNPKTTIAFAIPQAGHAKLSVYDSSGRRIAVLADGPMDAGLHEFTWNATGQASGVFFYRLEAGGERFTRKCVLLK